MGGENGFAGVRLLGLDIETTGLDTANDHICEVAWVIKEPGDPKPLVARTFFILPPAGFWDSTEYLKPTIQQLTKIQMKHLMAGEELMGVLSYLCADIEKYRVTHIAAHNGENFDKPFIQTKAEPFKENLRLSPLWEIPWIDTSVDVVYPEDCRHTNLLYVAAYQGFVNPFPHSALFDVMTMLKVLDNYDIASVIERASSPWAVVRAVVDFEQKDLAKQRRYSWETIGAIKFPKQWVKKIKECDVAKEAAEAPFTVLHIA